jgi:hypothetical protein
VVLSTVGYEPAEALKRCKEFRDVTIPGHDMETSKWESTPFSRNPTANLFRIVHRTRKVSLPYSAEGIGGT